MERFIIQASQTQPDGWVCTDQENGIVCRFKEHQFNETQKFTFLEDVEEPAPQIIATALREMADWLRANHYDKAMPKLTPEQHRIRIGEEIAELRKKREMTQQDVAKLSGILRPHVARVEQGRYNFGFDTLQAIAEALDADIKLVPRK